MSYENSIAFLGPAGTYCNEAALRFAARLGIDLYEKTPSPKTFDWWGGGAAGVPLYDGL